jgi:hypothetical protein
MHGVAAFALSNAAIMEAKGNAMCGKSNTDYDTYLDNAKIESSELHSPPFCARVACCWDQPLVLLRRTEGRQNRPSERVNQ